MIANLFGSGLAAALAASGPLAPGSPDARAENRPPSFALGKPLPEPTGLPVGLGGERASYAELVAKLGPLTGQKVEPTDSPATRTLADLRRGQVAWREKVKSLRVTFELRNDSKMLLKAEHEYAKMGRLVAPDYAYRLTFAMKGDKRYVDYRELTPSQTAGRSAAVLARPSDVTAYNGDQSRSYEPSRLLGTIKPGRQVTMENNFTEYCGFISWPAGPDGEKAATTIQHVPTALLAAGIYAVRPRLESVDGNPCHVVSSGWDTFWIDPQNGYCVRRRVMFRKSGLLDPGCLNYVQVCQDFRRVAEGVFLPTKCRRYSFATQNEPESTRGKLAKVTSVAVTELAVNDAADPQFELAFPPGTQVNDTILNKSYLVPHGEENLDRAIAESNMYIVDGKVIPVTPPLSWRRTAIWGVNGALLIVVAGTLAYRSYRKPATDA